MAALVGWMAQGHAVTARLGQPMAFGYNHNARGPRTRLRASRATSVLAAPSLIKSCPSRSIPSDTSSMTSASVLMVCSTTLTICTIGWQWSSLVCSNSVSSTSSPWPSQALLISGTAWLLRPHNAHQIGPLLRPPLLGTANPVPHVPARILVSPVSQPRCLPPSVPRSQGGGPGRTQASPAPASH